MWWNRRTAVALLVIASACAAQAALAAEPCTPRSGQPLRFVDVFDGPPERLAYLIPDVAGKRSGYWKLGYIYEAGRTATIRCKYADGQASDVKLADKINRCNYKIDANKALSLDCK